MALVSEQPEDREEPKIYRSMHSLWPEWHAKANCLGVEDELFFGSSSPDTRPSYTVSSIRMAKARCYECPVFEHCLRAAIRNREAYGVWAGTTMKERSKIFELIDTKATTEDIVVHALLYARPKK